MQTILSFVVMCLVSAPALCQQGVPSKLSVHVLAQPVETVFVTTTAEPMPLQDSDRSIKVLSPREFPGMADSVVDLLRGDSSLNVQSRAGEGVQADLSLRGTTFEQALVLVNGFRINDPETGHLNLDLPIPLDALTRVDIVHGSGSTFYGSDAIGGAVNLLTGPPTPAAVVARSGAGNYGSLEEHLRAAVSLGRFDEQLTGSRDSSDGFIADRNYSSNAVANEVWITSRPGVTDLLLASSDRPYGANLFYGPYNSRERTKGWFAGLRQELGQATSASFAYRRHSDVFVLFADRPAVYENNHVTSSYEAALGRADALGPNITLSYGLEEDGDTIQSNSLGHHARNQGAGYANLSMRSLGRISLSLGAREEVFSGGDRVFSPSVAAAVAVRSTLRLRASAGHGFRLPTYLDLYYHDPATVGNPALKPESSWSFEGAADWRPAGGYLNLTAAGFRLQQSNVIDYAKRVLTAPQLTAAQPWQAMNIPGLDLTGVEASADLRLNETQHLQFSYTAIQAGNAAPGFVSKYAYNFAAQNALFAWTAQLRQLTAFTQVNIVQRTGHVAYPLWDVVFSRNSGVLRPYARLLNLSNTGYQEIPQVPMQGRTLMAGVEFRWTHR